MDSGFGVEEINRKNQFPVISTALRLRSVPIAQNDKTYIFKTKFLFRLIT